MIIPKCSPGHSALESWNIGCSTLHFTIFLKWIFSFNCFCNFSFPTLGEKPVRGVKCRLPVCTNTVLTGSEYSMPQALITVWAFLTALHPLCTEMLQEPCRTITKPPFISSNQLLINQFSDLFISLFIYGSPVGAAVILCYLSHAILFTQSRLWTVAVLLSTPPALFTCIILTLKLVTHSFHLLGSHHSHWQLEKLQEPVFSLEKRPLAGDNF